MNNTNLNLSKHQWKHLESIGNPNLSIIKQKLFNKSCMNCIFANARDKHYRENGVGMFCKCNPGCIFEISKESNDHKIKYKRCVMEFKTSDNPHKVVTQFYNDDMQLIYDDYCSLFKLPNTAKESFESMICELVKIIRKEIKYYDSELTVMLTGLKIESFDQNI